MIKKTGFLLLSLIILCSLFCPTANQSLVFGQSGSVWLDAAKIDSQQPLIEIQSISDTSLRLQIRFPGIWVEPVKNDQGDFSRLFLEGYGHSAPLGAPDLPVFTTQVEIPTQSTAHISKVDVKTRTISLSDYALPTTILPMQMAASKSGPTPPWLPVDEAIYQQNQIYPSDYVSLPDSFQMRNHHIMPIQIQPVRYQPGAGVLELVEEITLTLTWENLIQPDLAVQPRGSVVFDDLVNEMVLNPSSAELDTKTLEGIGYLIITPLSLAPSLEDFVELKEAEGYEVTVATLETIGSTITAIKTYIEYAYHNWTIPPTYLLLVGDTNYIPSWPTSQTPACTTTYCFRKATDLYYATMTADYVPDLLVGRLPARDQAQLTSTLNKLTSYAALTGSEDWIKKAAFAATADTSLNSSGTYNYQVAEGSHNYVITNHTLPREYSGIFPSTPSPYPGGDKLYRITYSAQKTNLLTSINDERSLVIYSGHGSPTSWSDFTFYREDISSLDADQVYPFVAGFACETNDIANTSYPTVFGETWLVTPNKGAIAYLGSADYSYWGTDDILERSLFDKFYENTSFTPPISNSVFAGLNAVQTLYPDFTRYYWETYMLLGDPSQQIWINPAVPYFEIFPYPNSREICVGTPAQVNLYTTAFNGFNEAVTLTTNSMPAGLTVNYLQNPITPSEDTTLTLSANTSTPLGAATITIQGASPSYTETAALNLFIANQNPQFPLLISPEQNKLVDSISPILSWWKVEQAQTYQVQIATDSDFTNIVFDDSITDYSDNTKIQYDGSLTLDTNSIYYWRVRGMNACGIGDFNPVIWQFRTPPGPGDCPAGYGPQIDFFTDFETTSNEWVSLNQYDNNDWTRQTTRSQSPIYSYFAADIEIVSLANLSSPVIQVPVNSYSPTLRFWQWYEIENGGTDTCFDGGLLKYKLDDGSWTSLTTSQLLSNPYNGTIAAYNENPLAGQKAWCGNSGGWQKTVVDLSGFQGQNVQFKFQLGTDENVAGTGWYIDDFRLQSCYPLDRTYLPLISR